jgi:hypothetical protein
MPWSPMPALTSRWFWPRFRRDRERESISWSEGAEPRCHTYIRHRPQKRTIQYSRVEIFTDGGDYWISLSRV